MLVERENDPNAVPIATVSIAYPGKTAVHFALFTAIPGERAFCKITTATETRKISDRDRSDVARALYILEKIYG